jgi:hypothetical protein
MKTINALKRNESLGTILQEPAETKQTFLVRIVSKGRKGQATIVSPDLSAGLAAS